MDFGALPPETNSALMYVGQGPTPMLAAAAAWNGVAAELNTMASSYESVINRLSSEYWLGPASLSMAAAAQPLIAWLTYTSECSALAAAQALASAAAFEAALATIVPPAEVAANRAQLAALIASDGLGQNGPAIAATEARYSEMWAQDADTMYSYAASSAIAGRLIPLTTPLSTAGPDAVMNLASPGTSTAPSTVPNVLNALSALDNAEIPMYDVFHHMRAVEADWTANLAVDWAQAGTETDADAAKGAASDAASAAALTHTPAKIAGPPLRAGLGNATSLGRLSVPTCWSSTAPAVPTATVADGTGWIVPAEQDPITAIPGAPVLAGTGSETRVGTAPRYGFKPVVMPNRGLF